MLVLRSISVISNIVFTVFLYSPNCLVGETQLLTQVESTAGKGDLLRMCHIYPSDNLDYTSQGFPAWSYRLVYEVSSDVCSQPASSMSCIDLLPGLISVFADVCHYGSPVLTSTSPQIQHDDKPLQVQPYYELNHRGKQCGIYLGG